MMSQNSTILVKVSLENLNRAGFISASGKLGYVATLCGQSDVPALCFTHKAYVVDQSLQNMERLGRHGSVIVGLSEHWEYEYERCGGWLQHVFDEVVAVVRNLPEDLQEEAGMQNGFDEVLAAQILQILKQIYPASLQSEMTLKHKLDNKPDDRTLMTALDALLGDGFITGRPLREQALGETRLATLANIQITRQGRQSLESATALPHQAAVVHGDQFINYGNLGAAGRNSTGTVVTGDSWSQKDALSALDALLSQLQQYPAKTSDIERAQREFHKVRDEVADESYPNKSSLAKWLSRGKQLLATAALSQELFDAAHTVYKLFGM